MANMRVVFLEDVPSVAHGGEIKNVKSGFARNYLIPQKLAVPASVEAMKRVEKLTLQAEEKRLRQMEDLKGLAEALADKQIEIEMRTGTEGRLYGSVTNTMVASKLSELVGNEIDRRTIVITEGIRETGVYTANIRLHADVETTVTLVVHPIGEDPAETITKAAEEEKAEEDPTRDSDDPADVEVPMEEPTTSKKTTEVESANDTETVKTSTDKKGDSETEPEQDMSKPLPSADDAEQQVDVAVVEEPPAVDDTADTKTKRKPRRVKK